MIIDHSFSGLAYPRSSFHIGKQGGESPGVFLVDLIKDMVDRGSFDYKEPYLSRDVSPIIYERMSLDDVVAKIAYFDDDEEGLEEDFSSR